MLMLEVKAAARSDSIAKWRVAGGAEMSLGTLRIALQFENQQQASWTIHAEYVVRLRSMGDSDSLERWINNARAVPGEIETIQLEASSSSWKSEEK